MRKISVVLALLALAACGSKKDDGGTQGEGSAAAKPADKPMTCPPGNVIKDGACTAAITAEKVAAVGQQQSRLEELAKLLDRVDTVAVPVEMVSGLRQLDQWKSYVGKNEKLKLLDEGVASLDGAVKQLRVFKGGLEQASAGLGNLKGELERLMQDTGNAKRIEEVRAQISSQVRTTVEPLAKQVTDALQHGLAPLTARFADASNLVTGGCAMMALGRAGDKAKGVCEKATEAFAQGKKFIEDFQDKPAALFGDVTGKLEADLAPLLDDQARQLLDTTQAAVNDALKLPPGGAGSAAGKTGPAAAP